MLCVFYLMQRNQKCSSVTVPDKSLTLLTQCLRYFIYATIIYSHMLIILLGVEYFSYNFSKHLLKDHIGAVLMILQKRVC